MPDFSEARKVASKQSLIITCNTLSKLIDNAISHGDEDSCKAYFKVQRLIALRLSLFYDYEFTG